MLTPAGAAFVSEARRAVMYAQRAVESGAAACAGGVGVIRIGYTPLLGTAPLPLIRQYFSEVIGEVPVLFQSAYSIAQIEQVLTGHLIAGLVVLPTASSELRIDRVFRDQLVVAVPENSDLATRAMLHSKDIADQPIIWFGQLTNPQLYRHFVESCQHAGFTPNIVCEVSTVLEMLDWVATGVGIGFVRDSVRTRLRPNGVAFRELVAPELCIEIGIAYRNDDCSERLLTLLRVLSRLSTYGRSNGASPVEPDRK
jgi:DNA-binding transcriptional LysR family regulator